MIAVTQDEDWFEISLEEGEVYTIDLRANASGSGTLPYPLLSLIDSDGNWITQSYGYEDNDPQVVYVPEATGTYYVAVSDDYWETGSYVLEVTSEPYADDYGNDATTAGQIAAGESVTGVIGTPNDEDWFAITLSEGETYTIDLKGQDSGSGSLPDPYLILYDADDNWVDSNDDAGSYDSQLVYAPFASGTYFIVARELSEGTGTYTLSASAGEVSVADDALLML